MCINGAWVMNMGLVGDPFWLGLPGEEGNPFERVPLEGGGVECGYPKSDRREG